MHVLKRICAILLASRPALWANTGLLFLFGALIARKAGYRPPASFALYVAWFFAGANLFGMLLNDYFDRELDAQNPRKPRRTLPPSDYALGIGFSLASFVLIEIFFPNPYVFFWVAVAIVVNIAYSIPPLRIKERPPFDLLEGPANGLSAVLAGYYALAAHNWPDPAAVTAGFLLFCGTELTFQMLDIEVDKSSGIRTSATLLGRRFSLLGSACLMLAAAGLISLRNPLYSLGILPFLVIVFLLKNAVTDEERRRLDARLPVYYVAMCLPLALLYWIS